MLYHWRWNYHLPSLTLWALIAALLVFWKRVHRRQDSTFAVPLVLTFILLQMDGFSMLIASLAAIWILAALARRRETSPSVAS